MSRTTVAPGRPSGRNLVDDVVLGWELPRRQHQRNAVQAFLLLAGMVAVLGVLAWLLLGPRGVLWVLVGAVVAAAFRPKVPPRWVLSLLGARVLPEAVAPDLHHSVAVLARRAGLPESPALYHVASPLINAFAIGGPDDSALAVTDGLLRHLSSRQVVGVLAHEISHIRSGDLWIMNLSDVVGRFTHTLAYAGVVLIFMVPWTPGDRLKPLMWAATLAAVPTVVTVLQAAISRSREYDADLGGALLTGDPEGLAGALEALERADSRTWERLMVPYRRMPDPVLLRSHPPTEKRADRLRTLSLQPRSARWRAGGTATRALPAWSARATATTRCSSEAADRRVGWSTNRPASSGWRPSSEVCPQAAGSRVGDRSRSKPARITA